MAKNKVRKSLVSLKRSKRDSGTNKVWLKSRHRVRRKVLRRG